MRTKVVNVLSGFRFCFQLNAFCSLTFSKLAFKTQILHFSPSLPTTVSGLYYNIALPFYSKSAQGHNVCVWYSTCTKNHGQGKR